MAKIYEEFVLKHPNWSLVKIYAGKGISGTSTKHRIALNQMLSDSRAGKIDLIITKSVSRLARNTDIVRKATNSLKPEDSVERILDLFAQTRTNREFVEVAKKRRMF